MSFSLMIQILIQKTFYTMNKILISGTSGHVGSLIYDRINEKYPVITLNRNKQKNENNSLTYNDILNIQNNDHMKIISSCDTFIHVASAIDVDDLNPQISYFNCFQTHSLFSLLKRVGLNKMILISGASIVNSKDGIISENSTILPKSVYHLSKFYQEKLTEILNFDSYYNLRISSPISPIISKNTIFKVFMDNAISDNEIFIRGKGTRMQNYIDVRDVSRVVQDIINSDNYLSGTYNICSNNSISNLDLAKLITEVVSSKSKIKHIGKDFNDDKSWIFDNSKAKKNLNLKIEYPIIKTISDYFSLHK